MRRVARFAVALGGALAIAACSSDETVLGDEPPTEIAVDPLEFLGELPCSNDPGAAKAFVAVITDTDESFTLGASPPAACSSRMAFRYVTVGHVYTAEVDVYDVPASALFPAGGSASGSRVMHDASGAIVAPRWRTRCGEGAQGGAVAVADTSVVVAGCDPLEPIGTSTTAIVIDPADAIAASTAACAADGGTIDAIDVIPTVVPEGAELPTVTLGCGDAPVVFDEGITPGQAYEVRLEAHAEGDDAVSFAATCAVVAAEGIQRTAECSPFTSSGTLAIPTTSVEEAPGFLCGADFEAYDLALSGPADIDVPRTGCTSATVVAPVPSGHYEGTLRTYENGVVERTARCEVDVIPSATSNVTCSFD